MGSPMAGGTSDPPARLVLRPGTAQGMCEAPPSKSYTHRALVVAALSTRATVLRSPLQSEDTEASWRVVRALAQSASEEARDLHLPSQLSERMEVPALGLLSPRPPTTTRSETSQVDVGESGTTLRLFSAVAALTSRPVRFVGKSSLAARPMQPLLSALQGLGARLEGPPVRRSLPFVLTGPLHAGGVRLPGEESSQYVSAMLLALPVLPGESRVVIEGRQVSQPYIEATLAVLHHQGVETDRLAEGFRIPGGQSWRGGEIPIPGDASSAAYLFALGALGSGRLVVPGLSSEWPQADLAIVPVLRAAGARLREERGSGQWEVEGTGRHLEHFEADLDASPDLAPLLAVLASFARGRSVFRGGAHLVVKESDRRAGMERLVRGLGARCGREGELFWVEGPATSRSLNLPDLTDHRMVMSAAVAASALPEPSLLGDTRAVAKSYPRFFADVAKLGVASDPAPG